MAKSWERGRPGGALRAFTGKLQRSERYHRVGDELELRVGFGRPRKKSWTRIRRGRLHESAAEWPAGGGPGPPAAAPAGIKL